jgi:hypothetical protein
MQAIMNSKAYLKHLYFTGLVFVESFLFANVEAQVSSSEQITHQIQVFSILKGVVHVYQKSATNFSN